MRFAFSVSAFVSLLAASNSGGAEAFIAPKLTQRAHNSPRIQLPSPREVCYAFVPSNTTPNDRRELSVSLGAHSVAPAVAEAPPAQFIETELRGAAMRLHTRKQAPKEGEAEEKQPEPAEPYVPSHKDYLAFLVDSQHVYAAFEDVVNSTQELATFRNTGLERTKPLEVDIEFMVVEYDLTRPAVGKMGMDYADEIRRIGHEGTIPEFICHYYNFYFAHTAGGRMIGKQMSSLLLNNRTLEFYKWDGDLNKIKGRVKADIEAMAASWSREEKDECVAATAVAFHGGGGINSYLSGAKSPR